MKTSKIYVKVRPSATSSSVVKRTANHKGRSNRGRAGLPSFSVVSSSTSTPLAESKGSDDVRNNHGRAYSAACDNYSEATSREERYDDKELMEKLPNETLFVLTSLLNDPHRSIAIPVGNGGGTIQSVLPCQLYALLDTNDHQVVRAEIQQLLHTTHTVCQLRLLSSSSEDDDSHVIILRSQYCQAVEEEWRRAPEAKRIRQTTHTTVDHSPLDRSVLDWFLYESNIVDTVNEQEIQYQLEHRKWNDYHPTTTPLPPQLSVSAIVSTLLQYQFLRTFIAPNRVARAACDRNVYQLWLPSWGLVVQGWDRSVTNVLAHLKRSTYKERSLASVLKQSSSGSAPISRSILIEALVSQGKIHKVERPFGVFIRLGPQ